MTITIKRTAAAAAAAAETTVLGAAAAATTTILAATTQQLNCLTSLTRNSLPTSPAAGGTAVGAFSVPNGAVPGAPHAGSTHRHSAQEAVRLGPGTEQEMVVGMTRRRKMKMLIIL